MKFLLVAINAKYIHSNPAIYSLKEYARRYAQHVELAEFTINEALGEIRSSIYRRRPDAIGFSCYIWNISYVEALVQDLHNLLPETAIWLGGPEVSYDAEETLNRMPGAAGVMVGEGEATFLQLMEHYVEGTVELEQIRGLCYRAGESAAVKTEPRPMLHFEDVPFLYRNLPLQEHKIVYYETSRGCPFRCSYCLSSVEKQVRFRDLETVKRELDFFLEKRVAQVKLVDRTFNCKKSHSLAIWTYLLEHDNGVTNFHFEISADLLGEEEFQVMSRMRPGLIQLEIGVQTTNPDTLREIRRFVPFSALSRAVRRIRAMGNIHQHLDLIAGLPMEGYERFGHSFDDVYRLKPDQLQLGFLKVLKGSSLYDRVSDYGIVYETKPPYEVMRTRWMSYEEIIRLKSVEAVLEAYYNSGQFTTVLTWIEHFWERPFLFYEAFGDYCRQKQIEKISHSRMERYEILRAFVREQIFPKRAEPLCDLTAVLDSLLWYDFCLRENKKTTADFAPEWRPPREWVRTFFEEEEKNPKLLRGYEGYSWKQMMSMTRLERFPIRIEETAGTILPQKAAQVILFDYRNRNPLTKDAKTVIVSD